MATNKPFFRHRLSGVTRIVRAGYGKPSDWFALCKKIKARDGHKCIFCGAPEQPKLNIFHDVHHIILLSQGGTNAPANLGTTCGACHAKRPKHGHMKQTQGPVVKFDMTAVQATPTSSKFSSWRK